MPNPATTREQRLRKTKAQLIDEIDRAEEALRDAEERNALIILATQDNLFDWDLKTDRISFPIDGRERLGLLNWDCTGKGWANRIHPDDQEEDRVLFIAAMKGEQEQYFVENRLKDDDGNWRWLHTRGFFQRGPDGRAVRMIGSASDITERKRAEEELAEKEAHLRVALDYTPGGIMLVDRNLNYVLINKQHNELFDLTDGLAREGGSFIDVLRFQAERGDFGPGDKDALVEQVAATFLSGKTVSYEREISSSRRTLQVYVAPTPEGGMVSIVNDITERKKAEEELRVARDQAESASETKAAFLATMSHEIRTPMNGVIGMVDLLRQTEMNDDQQRMMMIVRESAYSLLTIINDILDFSKIEAGKLDLEAVPISICDALEVVGETLAPAARNKGIGLNIFVDPEIPDAVLGDQTRIRQILFNLGGNAVKFTEKGKVLIRADRVPSKAKKKVTVRFRVIDSGIGIPKDAQEELFQAFSQAERSTARRFGGTGLGLSICERLTKMMKGSIEVESATGKGSVFTVTATFPVAEEHRIISDGQDLAGQNVLMVVRDDDVRELFPEYLRHWNAEVTTCGQIGRTKRLAQDAVAQGRPYDVIVLGAGWTHRKQSQVIDSIRSAEELSKTRFILLTPSRAKADRVEIVNTLYVDSNPLYRAGFIKAVAVAVGRVSPEIQYDEDVNYLKGRQAPTVDEAYASGHLILVAEDNAINQEVILRQLNVLGYAAEVARDGKEALEILQGNSHALLLADCHMPNMDGFELTASIRKSENKTGTRLPIIAITAGVLKAEVDRCFEAGMDDYLSKPLDMSKLNGVLRKWMPVPEHGSPDAAAEAPRTMYAEDEPDDGVTGPVDPNALKSLLSNDAELIRKLLAKFVVLGSETVAEIEDACQRKSAEEVSVLCHKLKSSSKQIGAYELSEVCVTLESAGADSDWPMIERDVPILRERMSEVADFIANQP